jgi:hypothetical protein
LNRVEPVLTRPWALQQRLISRRLLRFTPLELIYECYAGNETESGFSWVDSIVKHMLSGLSKSAADGVRSSGPNVVASMQTWRGLVRDFTQLQLTRHEDTLPAMAGLAKKVQTLTGRSADDYLAGLWKQTFIDDLMWLRVPCIAELDRVNRNIQAWSWAQNDMPKSFNIVALTWIFTGPRMTSRAAGLLWKVIECLPYHLCCVPA